MKHGFFTTFEGVEGSGKSTQIRCLAATGEGAGVRVRLTREPGGSAVAERIRDLLLHPPGDGNSAMGEALLHYAARRDHLDHVILPALRAGQWVICDRYADSTMAYQGHGFNLGAATVAALHDLVIGAFAPDLTIILDLPVEIGLARARARSPAGDRYERLDVAFHQRVRDAFLDIARAEPERCIVIDAEPAPEIVAAAVRHAVAPRLGVSL
ncbi:MAG: dTMP kinase [Rhodospirillales bacterium]|nr:dTMP kinase [Rhodospirillales bacterium]